MFARLGVQRNCNRRNLKNKICSAQSCNCVMDYKPRDECKVGCLRLISRTAKGQKTAQDFRLRRANIVDPIPLQRTPTMALNTDPTSHATVTSQRMRPLHILPPYLMRQLGLAQDPTLRLAAKATLRIDHAIRSRRLNEDKRSAKKATRTQLPEIAIFDAEHREELPGRAVRSAHQGPAGDPSVNEAWAGLQATLQFLNEIFQRDGLDGDGHRLRASVHFGERYMNAFWDGEQMVFGDGDGVIFKSFTAAVDVIAHELGHGVIADEGQLAYVYEPGALNESLADVFSSMVKQFQQGQHADQADWLIGDALLMPTIRGRALRSLAAPGTAYDDPVLGRDPQPAHMKHFVRTREDNGGVHLNSGIPNHAFFLASVGIGGPTWEGAGPVWYDALRDPAVTPSTDFAQFARLTELAAVRRYGLESRQWRVVREAWAQVGVTARGTERPLPWPLGLHAREGASTIESVNE